MRVYSNRIVFADANYLKGLPADKGRITKRHMAYVAQLWTLNGLATELGRDRRAIGKALMGVVPANEGSGQNRWLMKTVVDAIYEKPGDALELTEERARLAKEQADKTALDNAQRRGELLEVGVVEAEVTSAFARVRSRLLAIPSKTAPLVSQVETPAEAEAIIRSAVIEALRELSETDVTSPAEDDEELVEGSNSSAEPLDKSVGGRRKKALT